MRRAGNQLGRPVSCCLTAMKLEFASQTACTRSALRSGEKNGRLRRWRTELYGDTGAYASLGEKVMTRATTTRRPL